MLVRTRCLYGYSGASAVRHKQRGRSLEASRLQLAALESSAPVKVGYDGSFTVTLSVHPSKSHLAHTHLPDALNSTNAARTATINHSAKTKVFAHTSMPCTGTPFLAKQDIGSCKVHCCGPLDIRGPSNAALVFLQTTKTQCVRQ